MTIEFKRRKETEILLKLRGNGRIKVIEGLRQVGKSYLLKNLFSDALLALDVKKDEIAFLDFLKANNEIRDEAKLKSKVADLLQRRK